VMGSYDLGVRVVQAGYVKLYGSGIRARSAPAGTRLLAFVLDLLPGDRTNFGPVTTPRLGIVVDGGSAHTFTMDTNAGIEQTFVTAVPQRAQSVELLLTDDGITQRLSLITGRPDSDNIAVYQRTSRSIRPFVVGLALARVTFGGQTIDAPLTI